MAPASSKRLSFLQVLFPPLSMLKRLPSSTGFANSSLLCVPETSLAFIVYEFALTPNPSSAPLPVAPSLPTRKTAPISGASSATSATSSAAYTSIFISSTPTVASIAMILPILPLRKQPLSPRIGHPSP